MTLLGNILWFFLGGFFGAIGWFMVGILWCITIVGIPVGTQCFKFAQLSLAPFGKEVEYSGNTGSLLLNILWLIFGGIEIALGHLFAAAILYITIIGIPFAKQNIKLARLALTPFGSRIVNR